MYSNVALVITFDLGHHSEALEFCTSDPDSPPLENFMKFLILIAYLILYQPYILHSLLPPHIYLYCPSLHPVVHLYFISCHVTLPT